MIGAALAVLSAGCGSHGGPSSGSAATVTTTTIAGTAPAAIAGTARSTPTGRAGGTDATDPTSATDPVPDPAQLPMPADADGMAVALGEAELAVRRAELPATVRAAWGRRQQALYRHLARHESWADDVLAGVDPTVASAVSANWTARQNLMALLATEELHDTVPAWRVVEPLPPDTLLRHYELAETETGIPWEYVAAINLVETRMGRIQGTSTAGAVGPMQFLPTTWAECCEGDPTDPADAILGAAIYLRVRGGPDDMARAVWGYNNSDFYVAAVTAYAEVLMADREAYHGYHAWEVYYLTTEGLVRLPVGYEQEAEIDAAEFLLDHPELLLSG